MEQIVSAMLLTTASVAYGAPRVEGAGAASAEAQMFEEPCAEASALMDRVAAGSMRAYRALVTDEAVWDFYLRATPIEHISRIPIASRPVSRTAAEKIALDDLRAIPWVFAWTQTRYVVPGWFGIGGALGEELESGQEQLMRRLYLEWPLFRAVVDNAEREMARARLPIARYYAEQSGSTGGAEIHDLIAEEFSLARAALLRITGSRELMESVPVIRRSIELRNPYTDVLNLIQVELLRRYAHAASDSERDTLRMLIFQSINGIAAAMQATG
jgi:phosphoenolpyruvate carboxylase